MGGLAVWLGTMCFSCGYDAATIGPFGKMSIPSMVIGYGGLLFLAGVIWGNRCSKWIEADRKRSDGRFVANAEDEA